MSLADNNPLELAAIFWITFLKALNLSIYATKTDLKNIVHVDTSNFALKTNLASLKSEVDKLDIDK